MVGGHTDVGVAAFDHLEHALQHADDGAVWTIDAFVEAALTVEVAEELVSSVDEVNDHFEFKVSIAR